jgi:hypothetical protein
VRPDAPHDPSIELGEELADVSPLVVMAPTPLVPGDAKGFRHKTDSCSGTENLNAYAERWVRSAKEECLSKFILFSEASLRRALADFNGHYHAERNHQGKGNALLSPSQKVGQRMPRSRVCCRERLGGC